ncbi:hypothetical protein YC2023_103787 [Brassica napus]
MIAFFLVIAASTPTDNASWPSRKKERGLFWEERGAPAHLQILRQRLDIHITEEWHVTLSCSHTEMRRSKARHSIDLQRPEMVVSFSDSRSGPWKLHCAKLVLFSNSRISIVSQCSRHQTESLGS